MMLNKTLKCCIFSLLAMGWISGCFDARLVRFNPRTEACSLHLIDIPSPVAVDILVVVDNSGSMAAEQGMLREAFPELLRDLLDPLHDPDTGRLLHAPVRNLHIGVVSTDMGVGDSDVHTCAEPNVGDDGVLLHAPEREDCKADYPAFLSYSVEFTDHPDPNLINELAADFGCLAVLGTNGCGFEQQLEAAHKALLVHARPGGANEGFLREDSVLMVLFVTDEEDCSAADLSIFDVSSLPYSICQVCYYEKDKLHSLDRYYNDISSLRSNPASLVLGFIVGVPPGEPMCEGRGREIGECLTVPAMQEIIRPDGERLQFACKYPPDCSPPDPPDAGNCQSEAFPGRRFVELAQMFGDSAVVQSICTDSFAPAMDALTEKFREAICHQGYRYRDLPMVKDPEDPAGCRCVAECAIVEVLKDDRPCPEDKPPRDDNGDTIRDMTIDAEGLAHSHCILPQAGSILADCGMDCTDPASLHSEDPERDGWWYNPTFDPYGDGSLRPSIALHDIRLELGSQVYIHCCSEVCPGGRQCGPEDIPGSKCCNVNEYCFRPGDDKNTAGFCLVREDICREFGDDAWCPGAGAVGNDPLIGGLCCLDPDADGDLDMIDLDGDGLEDAPAQRCRDGGCVSL